MACRGLKDVEDGLLLFCCTNVAAFDQPPSAMIGASADPFGCSNSGKSLYKPFMIYNMMLWYTKETKKLVHSK